MQSAKIVNIEFYRTAIKYFKERHKVAHPVNLKPSSQLLDHLELIRPYLKHAQYIALFDALKIIGVKPAAQTSSNLEVESIDTFRGVLFDSFAHTGLTMAAIELYQFLFDNVIVPVAKVLQIDPAEMDRQKFGEKARYYLQTLPKFSLNAVVTVLEALRTLRNDLAHPWVGRGKFRIYVKALMQTSVDYPVFFKTLI